MRRKEDPVRYKIVLIFFFFNDTATTEIYTLSLHDALPICARQPPRLTPVTGSTGSTLPPRSEEHTSELQSPCNLVCRLLLEKNTNKATAGTIAGARSATHSARCERERP